jgi:carotenoid cleavage dioxygenase
MAIDAPAFPDHPYLTGAFEPVHDELVADDLPVRGELPAALRGSFLRNGGNPAFAPLGRFHLFDGDGMVHALEIEDGRARYRNRFVESAGLLAERRAGRALFGGLSEFVMPDPEVLAEAGVIKNTANTHVIGHAGRILALMEGARPTELTPELDTVGEYDFDGALDGPMTAHPKLDPVSGELVFFGYSPRPPYLRIHVADAAGRLVRSEPIDLPGPVMMHDFAVTERSVVIFDLPAVFDLDAFVSGGTSVRWAPERGARIGVMPRDGGNDDVTWTEVEPFYVFHFLNAFDHGDGSVVVDGCRAERLPTAFGDEVLPEPVQPSLHRWHIDPSTGRVHDEALDDRPVDFPRVSPLVESRPNRYGYTGHASTWDAEIARFDGFVKYDLGESTSTAHIFGRGVASGEPVFAPDPDGEDEDAGWLLTFVEDLATRTSTVEIVDARDLAGGSVASVALPRRVPFGFHGSWLPAPA